MTRTRLITIIATGLACAALAGCGGTTAESAPAPAGMAIAGEAAPADVKSAPQQQVIATAQMAIQVRDVPEGTAAVVRIVSAAKGTIQQQDLMKSGEDTTSTVTARVPAASLDAVMADVGRLGDVQSVSRQASDVTQQAVDLDARIGALQDSIARLRDLLAKTSSVADLVAVETELGNRQAELDSLTAQRAYLADQVAMSTLTVTLTPTVQVGGWQAPGFVVGLQNGVSAVIGAVAGLITGLGFVLPFILIGLVIVVPTIWVIRRRRR